MASTPSPRSAPLAGPPSSETSPRSHATTTRLPDRSVPSLALDTSGKETKDTSISKPAAGPSFVPAWRRPTLTRDGEADRRPSVQFVPQIREAGTPTSRSSSAKPSTRSSKATFGGNVGTAHGRRLSSPPPPAQFTTRVSFDTFANKEASDFSLTLNRKHRDYEYTKRSRTFLCGTDTNDYSDTALEWLLDELVDDGDEVVCLRVVEKHSREALKWAGGQGERGYRLEAERMLEGIEQKNTEDRAINLVLEFSIGQVQETIQQMIRLYEPAMLVVGTKGRSLTGYQGLLSSGSVSKYCLQYSPVPVIVVRPSSKRESKKRKRLRDPSRTGYRDILDKSDDAPRGRGTHLLDHSNRSSAIGILGEGGSRDPDEEARKVAEAIGYTPRGSRTSLPNDTTTRGRSDTAGSQDGTGRSPPADERLLKSPDLRSQSNPEIDSDDEDGPGIFDDSEDETPQDTGELRPEDEAAMLAYERAMKVVEEEQEEAEARAARANSRGPGNRSRSRGHGQVKDDNDEGGGAAVLGLLAQLDGPMKGRK
ncbi:hypothetical protein MBLNU230_g3398t1 [Neophaeotheca triangularis]